MAARQTAAKKGVSIGTAADLRRAGVKLDSQDAVVAESVTTGRHTELKASKVAGATSGVMAPGAVGRAAREAAHTGVIAPAKATGWRDPKAKFADDDDSIDARMWRTYTDGIRK